MRNFVFPSHLMSDSLYLRYGQQSNGSLGREGRDRNLKEGVHAIAQRQDRRPIRVIRVSLLREAQQQIPEVK